MTPQEEAKRLVESFNEVMPFADSKLFYKSIDETKRCVDYMEKVSAKQCALICVEEILKNQYDMIPYGFIKHWEKVKQEIEKL